MRIPDRNQGHAARGARLPGNLPAEHRTVREVTADAGVYLVALELAHPHTLGVGSLGVLRFEKGWYVYAGSARNGLSQRLERHRRTGLGKALRWHVDFLRTKARAVLTFPIPTCLDLECRLAQDVRAISAGMIPGFGCSDCRCPSHLFRFPVDPLRDRRFVSLLSRYRHRIALGR